MCSILVLITTSCSVLLGLSVSEIVGAVIFLTSDAVTNENIQPALDAMSAYGSDPNSDSKVASRLILACGVLNSVFAICGLVLGVLGILRVFGFLDEMMKIIMIGFSVTIGVLAVIQWVGNGLAIGVRNSVNNDMTKTSMTSAMNTEFKSNLIGSESISNAFNYMFLQYECCGVEALSPSLRFQDTSWCTTTGTDCQTGTAKLPNLCCIGITVENIASASTNCKSAATDGTYYSKGCFEAYSDDVRSKYVGIIVEGVLCSFAQIFTLVSAIFVAIVYKPIGKET